MAPSGQLWLRAHDTRLAFRAREAHSPHLPAHCLRLRRSTARTDQVQRPPLRWVALWSPRETRSLRPFCPDVRQPAIWGCTGEPAVLPQLREGSPPSVAHGRDIDNFLSIGRPQAPRSSCVIPAPCRNRLMRSPMVDSMRMSSMSDTGHLPRRTLPADAPGSYPGDELRQGGNDRLRGAWRWTLRTADPDGTVRLVGAC